MFQLHSSGVVNELIQVTDHNFTSLITTIWILRWIWNCRWIIIELIMNRLWIQVQIPGTQFDNWETPYYQKFTLNLRHCKALEYFCVHCVSLRMTWTWRSSQSTWQWWWETTKYWFTLSALTSANVNVFQAVATQFMLHYVLDIQYAKQVRSTYTFFDACVGRIDFKTKVSAAVQPKVNLLLTVWTVCSLWSDNCATYILNSRFHTLNCIYVK